MFDKEKEKRDIQTQESKSDHSITYNGNSINIVGVGKIMMNDGVVGTHSGGTASDYYVYEWFVKETREVFYVGKGRGNRFKEHHEKAYVAEKIRNSRDTDVRFVATGLTEEQALEIETEEMCRILNETNDRLTNRITPLFAKRDNGYSKSHNTPAFMPETAPILYSTEIDEHYFDIHGKLFDKVQMNCLCHPFFIDKKVTKDELSIVYGGNYEKYYTEVRTMLNAIGSSVLKSRFAKSVTAWIYPSDDYVCIYDLDQKKAVERIGHRIPSYHLIDVWKYLKSQSVPHVDSEKAGILHDVPHNRVHLSQIKNLHDWQAGFDAGYHFWEEGERERKVGNSERAIELFDEARYNGYFAPALYNSYALVYRKLKDAANEIAILEEGIERYRVEDTDYSQIILRFEEQKQKALVRLNKEKQ